ncbi:MAG: SOS response-associated peptidase family protein [Eubacteriaceae bacterium]|nr:SOS response-associated peptidase family protein [Eubacteriaceae bacterium]
MCGRYNFIWDKQIAEMIRLKDLVWGIDPDYELPDGEVFPGQRLPVLVPGGDKAKVALEKWGIKTEGRNSLLINARSETAAERPTFRPLWLNSRCVIPASGFYEFDDKNRKYLFTPQNAGMLYMAGMLAPSGFVIMTGDADDTVAPVHHRMPILLTAGRVVSYLNGLYPADSQFENNVMLNLSVCA